jgi:hypothetical protein
MIMDRRRWEWFEFSEGDSSRDTDERMEELEDDDEEDNFVIGSKGQRLEMTFTSFANLMILLMEQVKRDDMFPEDYQTLLKLELDYTEELITTTEYLETIDDLLQRNRKTSGK